MENLRSTTLLHHNATPVFIPLSCTDTMYHHCLLHPRRWYRAPLLFNPPSISSSCTSTALPRDSLHHAPPTLRMAYNDTTLTLSIVDVDPLCLPLQWYRLSSWPSLHDGAIVCYYSNHITSVLLFLEKWNAKYLFINNPTPTNNRPTRRLRVMDGCILTQNILILTYSLLTKFILACYHLP